VNIFVIGTTGFVGAALARHLAGSGHTVTGRARTDAGAAALDARGIRPVAADLEPRRPHTGAVAHRSVRPSGPAIVASTGSCCWTVLAHRRSSSLTGGSTPSCSGRTQRACVARSDPLQNRGHVRRRCHLVLGQRLQVENALVHPDRPGQRLGSSFELRIQIAGPGAVRRGLPPAAAAWTASVDPGKRPYLAAATLAFAFGRATAGVRVVSLRIVPRRIEADQPSAAEPVVAGRPARCSA
jgi:hypothetical protein